MSRWLFLGSDVSETVEGSLSGGAERNFPRSRKRRVCESLRTAQLGERSQLWMEAFVLLSLRLGKGTALAL